MIFWYSKKRAIQNAIKYAQKPDLKMVGDTVRALTNITEIKTEAYLVGHQDGESNGYQKGKAWVTNRMLKFMEDGYPGQCAFSIERELKKMRGDKQ